MGIKITSEIRIKRVNIKKIEGSRERKRECPVVCLDTRHEGDHVQLESYQLPIWVQVPEIDLKLARIFSLISSHMIHEPHMIDI